jgi:hypothetical protein
MKKQKNTKLEQIEWNFKMCMFYNLQNLLQFITKNVYVLEFGSVGYMF